MPRRSVRRAHLRVPRRLMAHHGSARARVGRATGTSIGIRPNARGLFQAIQSTGRAYPPDTLIVLADCAAAVRFPRDGCE